MVIRRILLFGAVLVLLVSLSSSGASASGGDDIQSLKSNRLIEGSLNTTIINGIVYPNLPSTPLPTLQGVIFPPPDASDNPEGDEEAAEGEGQCWAFEALLKAMAQEGFKINPDQPKESTSIVFVNDRRQYREFAVNNENKDFAEACETGLSSEGKGDQFPIGKGDLLVPINIPTQ